VIRYSIIICTFNRAAALKHALESLLAIEWPDASASEVLVVDNNSNDNTKDVVAAFSKHSPMIKYIKEATQGSNFARNCGISSAKGSILVFTDDDVEFTPNWLSNIEDAFRDFPHADCITGKITPKFLEGDPSWIPDGYLYLYGKQYYGSTPKVLNFPLYPVEMNMAIKKGVFDIQGGFSTDVTRDAKTLKSNDGKIFFEKLSALSGKVVYVPRAEIFHLIPKERLQREWLFKRLFWQGYSDASFDCHVARTGRIRSVYYAIRYLSDWLRAITGHNINPRKIYWHYRSLTLAQKGWQFYLIGQARYYLGRTII
jgi:glycosyltransferase involved in cell wall biosynthesis